MLPSSIDAADPLALCAARIGRRELALESWMDRSDGSDRFAEGGAGQRPSGGLYLGELGHSRIGEIIR